METEESSVAVAWSLELLATARSAMSAFGVASLCY